MITIFTTSDCRYCVMAKRLMDEKGLKYQALNIQDSSEIMDQFIAKTSGARFVPQILVNDTLVGGYDALKVAIETEEFTKLLENNDG